MYIGMGYNNGNHQHDDAAALKKILHDVLDVSQRCYVLHILSFTFQAFKATFGTFDKQR
jgi:hypothetical protein